MRDSNSRLTSRLPLRSSIPTMPHMIRFSFALASNVWSRRCSRRARMRGPTRSKQAGVDAVVVLDHALEAESAFDSAPCGVAMLPGEARCGEIRADLTRQRVAVSCGHRAPGQVLFD